MATERIAKAPSFEPATPIEDREGGEPMTLDEYVDWWLRRVVEPTVKAMEAGESR